MCSILRLILASLVGSAWTSSSSARPTSRLGADTPPQRIRCSGERSTTHTKLRPELVEGVMRKPASLLGINAFLVVSLGEPEAGEVADDDCRLVAMSIQSLLEIAVLSQG